MRELLQRFLNKDVWVYLRLNSGFFYKCKLIEISDGNIVIVDRYGGTSVFKLENIDQVSEWR